MINKETGEIRFTSTLNASPEMNFSDAMALTDDLQKSVDDMKNGWKWIRLKAVESDIAQYHIGLAFNEGDLQCLDFTVDPKDSDLSDYGYENWSAEKEQNRLKKFEQWLTNEIGQKRSFDWGEIQALYDPKASFSSIVVNYNKTQKTTGTNNI
ncbi:hypothetical protein [uncultured Sunxiuqinia sp.]|uniref:hypothetical protein n=1 Tax=uncultured Sunxiuqinia sp. TaxID=1573825 RepID=UPI002AA91CED|nr:hypothetical protein [uncultured Sunxiuqinia sp.]